MGDKRLIHDAAFACATALTDFVRPTSEDVHEFHRRAYQIIKAAIEAYEVQKSRETGRLGPSPN